MFDIHRLAKLRPLAVAAMVLLSLATGTAEAQRPFVLSVAGIDQSLPRDPLPVVAADRLGALDALRFLLSSAQIAVDGDPMLNNRAVNLPQSATTIDAAVRDVLRQARLTYTFTGNAIHVSELARRSISLPSTGNMPMGLEGQIDLSALGEFVRGRLAETGAREISLSSAAVDFLGDQPVIDRAEQLANGMRGSFQVVVYDAWIAAVPRPNGGVLPAPEGGRLIFRAPEEGMNVYIVNSGRTDMPALIKAIANGAAAETLATPKIGALNNAPTTYVPPKAPRFTLTPIVSPTLLTTEIRIDRANALFASAGSNNIPQIIATAEGRPEDAIIVTTNKSLANAEAAGVIILKPRVMTAQELMAAMPKPRPNQIAQSPALPRPLSPVPTLPHAGQPSYSQPALPQPTQPLLPPGTQTGNPALPASNLDDIKQRLGMQASAQGPVPSLPVPQQPIPAQQPVAATPSLPGATNGAGAVQEAAIPPEPFVALSGRTLRDTLKAWSTRSGWSLVWATDRDYVLKAGATFHGDFVQASSEFLRAFAKARPPVKGTFYAGNKVLTVTTTEDEWTN